jgi:CRISP-associated protein Cas1
MNTVYILEHGSYLRREGEALNVIKDGRTVDSIPADGLKKLILVGYVSLSGAVLDFLIRKRVETAFVTPSGRFLARLAIDEHRHVALRSAQYLNLHDPAFTLKTAAILVMGKITNMANLLLIRARQQKDEALHGAAARMKAMEKHVTTAQTLEVLRGYEGAASRIYFSVFKNLIQNPLFSFAGRNKRPPLDPVNALLSFVYTLLTHEVLSAIKVAGLDPYLGSLHDIEYGRPSLACDLVEEYRCFLGDRMVLTLINRRAISPDDFIYRQPVPTQFVDEAEMKSKRPVQMKPEIGKAFISAYEQMMNRRIHYNPLEKQVEYRWLILNQVRRFGEYLENPEKEYTPMVWEK